MTKFCSTALLIVSCVQSSSLIEGEHFALSEHNLYSMLCRKFIWALLYLQYDWIKWINYQLSWQDSSWPRCSQWSCWLKPFRDYPYQIIAPLCDHWSYIGIFIGIIGLFLNCIYRQVFNILFYPNKLIRRSSFKIPF